MPFKIDQTEKIVESVIEDDYKKVRQDEYERLAMISNNPDIDSVEEKMN